MTMRFGSIEVRPVERRLLVEGRVVAIGARAFDLLMALIERRDRAVGKNELLDLVWPGLVVEENNLQVQISALRKALGTEAIATIPGRGYRFALPAGSDAVAPVQNAAVSPPSKAENLPGNVPLPVDALIGREQALSQLCELVSAHRLVSIVGAGGIGKTRLALALAHEMRARFADGVWWIELAALTDPKLVDGTVAHALGLHLPEGRPPSDALASALADLQVLIVLDNCEHMVDVVTSMIDAVVSRVPTVSFLVTSQEPLKTHAEQLFRLDPLKVPVADSPLSADEAGQYSSVSLFVERAKAGDRSFEINAANVDAVAEICRRLDGIPLAIELAAARVPLMKVEGLRQRLDERFRVLTAGARTVLRRHQTLRAALEWSYGLLAEEERVVLRRLGVCTGSFSLTMAQTVAADDELDEWAVLTILGHLVDRSLVVVEGTAEPRYRLLETTRSFAIEQLAAAGETTVWMRRHAQSVFDELKQRVGGRWFNERVPGIALEVDNLRAAMDWALGPNGDAELAVGLAAHSLFVWRSTTGLAEGLLRVGAAIEKVSSTTPLETQAALWHAYAALGTTTTRRDCFDAAQRAVDLWRKLGNGERLYQALTVRAAIAARRCEFDAARSALCETAEIENPAWAPRRRSMRAFAEWIFALWEGRYDDAREHALRQANLVREGGDLVGEQLALGNVATTDVSAGKPDRAVPQLRAVIVALDKLGQGAAAGHMVLNLAAGLLALGQTEAALSEARNAYALLRREGDQHLLLWMLTRLAVARGSPQLAVKIAGYALHALHQGGLDVRRYGFSDLVATIPMDDTQRQALLLEGESMPEEQAFALALAASPAN